MELPLKLETISCCRMLFDGTLTREELSETIVPDACPDVQKVLEVAGSGFLSRMEPAEGRTDLSGVIHAQVLYRPEGGGDVVSLHCTIPFQFIEEQQGVQEGCLVQGTVRVASAEARLLNPRKLLLRMELKVDLQVLERTALTWASAVEGKEPVEQLVQPVTGRVICCAPSKPLSFSDQLSLSGTKPMARQLMKYRGWTACSEAKVVGSKLVLKGSVYLSMLCQDEEGGLFSAEFDLPFSQILDVEGAGEGAAVRASVPITDLTCTLIEGGRTIDVAIDLQAQAIVQEEKTLTLLQDAYSVRYPVTLEACPLTLLTLEDGGLRRQTLREMLETSRPWQSVSDLWSTLGTVTQVQDGGVRMVTAAVTVHALGVEEDGTPVSAERRYAVSVQLETPPECTVLLQCQVEDLRGDRTAGGLEVRLTVGVWYEIQSSHPVTMVTGLTIAEEQERDSTVLPSVVLRRVEEGEGLWTIAKTYSTTRQDICQANGLEEEVLTPGQFLLIPKRR